MESILEIIENAKNDVLAYEEKKLEYEEKTKTKKILEEKLTKLVNTKEKCIKDTIEEERKKIDDAYNTALVEITRKVNNAKNEKNKEIQKNKQELVEKETKDLREKNEYIKIQKKQELKNNKISSIVNTEGYWILFKPSNIVEILKTILLFVLLTIIPTIIIIFLRKDIFDDIKSKTNACLLLAIVVLLILIVIWNLFNYIFSNNMSKEIEEKIKAFRQNIKTNNKAIEKITKNIMQDTDESKFDYTEIDREIETANLELKNLKEKKDNDIEYFNSTVKEQIKQKIEQESNDEINEVKYKLDEINKNYEEITNNYKRIEQEINDKYEKTIGKENLNLNKLVELETTIKNNKQEDLIHERAKDLLNKK